MEMDWDFANDALDAEGAAGEPRMITRCDTKKEAEQFRDALNVGKAFKGENGEWFFAITGKDCLPVLEKMLPMLSPTCPVYANAKATYEHCVQRYGAKH
jgi:hypothetical protein